MRNCAHVNFYDGTLKTWEIWESTMKTLRVIVMRRPKTTTADNLVILSQCVNTHRDTHKFGMLVINNMARTFSTHHSKLFKIMLFGGSMIFHCMDTT